MYNKKKKIKHKTLKIFFLLIGTIVTAVFLEAGILYLVNSQNVYKTSKVLLDQTIEIVEKNKQSEVRTVVADIPVYKGIALYVADKETGRIYGATDVSKIGVKLDDMGLRKQRKKIAKEKKWKEEDTESSPYAAVKPEIKINRDYFEQLEEPEEEQPEEKTEKAAPEISVNLDSEYFKWKEQEGKEEDSEDEKQPEKKGFFGKFMK